MKSTNETIELGVEWEPVSETIHLQCNKLEAMREAFDLLEHPMLFGWQAILSDLILHLEADGACSLNF